MRLLNAERTTIVSSLNAETRAVSSSQGVAPPFAALCQTRASKRADVPRAPPAGHEQGAGGADLERRSLPRRLRWARLRLMSAHPTMRRPLPRRWPRSSPSCLHARARAWALASRAFRGQPVQRAWSAPRAVRRRAERQEAAEGPEARQNARAAPGRARATAAGQPRIRHERALAEADASLGPTGVASVLAAADGGEITNGPVSSAWAMPSGTPTAPTA